MATDTSVASMTGLATPATMATGAFTSDGNATSLTLGYTPRYGKVVNLTDNVEWEYMEGFPVGTTQKSAAGAQTIDATNAILVGQDAGLHEPGSSMLLSAALCGNNKQIAWMTIG